MVTTLSIVACLSGMVGSLLYARGALKHAYRVSILSSLSYCAINLAVAYRHESGVLLLIVPSAWGVAMAVAGLMRIQKEGA